QCKARFGKNGPDGSHALDRRTSELALEFKTAPAAVWVQIRGIARGPGEERDFVDWCEQGFRIGLLSEPFAESTGQASESSQECGLEYVDAGRPAVVAQIPNDFNAGGLGRLNDRQHG